MSQTSRQEVCIRFLLGPLPGRQRRDHRTLVHSRPPGEKPQRARKEAHRVVREWEERSPHEPEAGTFLRVGDREYSPFVSMRELSLRDRARWLRYETEKLHDRVMRVRDRVPPEPPGLRPWGKPWGR